MHGRGLRRPWPAHSLPRTSEDTMRLNRRALLFTPLLAAPALAMAPLGLRWFEEPVDPIDFEALAAIAAG